MKVNLQLETCAKCINTFMIVPCEGLEKPSKLLSCSQQLIPPDCMAQLDLWAPDTSAYVCMLCVCTCAWWEWGGHGLREEGKKQVTRNLSLNTNGCCLLPRINLEGERDMPSGSSIHPPLQPQPLQGRSQRAGHQGDLQEYFEHPTLERATCKGSHLGGSREALSIFQPLLGE